MRAYVEELALLELVERRARRLAREIRRRETGRARISWTAFSCTAIGRRIQAAKDVLISRIETQETALCG